MKTRVFWCITFFWLLLFAPYAKAVPQVQPFIIILTIERIDSSFQIAGNPLFRYGYAPRVKSLIALPFTLSIYDNGGASLHKTTFDFPWIVKEGLPPEQQKKVTLTLPWQEGAKRVKVTDQGGAILFERVIEKFSHEETSLDSYEWVAGEGDPNTAFKIVFLGDDYEGQEEKFVQDVAAHTEALLGASPIGEFVSSLLIYRISSVDNDLGCYLSETAIPDCDDAAVFVAAAAVPYDEIVVLLNSEIGAGVGSMITAGEPFPGTYTISTSPYPPVTPHEAGHSMFGLMDEYLIGNDESSEGSPFGPNCDYAECPNFEGIPEAGCVPVCGYANLFRSKDTCLMHSVGEFEFSFCPVCRSAVETILSQYGGSEDGEDDVGSPLICDGQWHSITPAAHGQSIVGVYVPPGKSTQAANSIATAARGDNDCVYSNWYKFDSGTWTGWQEIPGWCGATSAPSSYVGDALDVLVQGGDLLHHHIVNWTNGWGTTNQHTDSSPHVAYGSPTTATDGEGTPWEFRSTSTLDYKCGDACKIAEDAFEECNEQYGISECLEEQAKFVIECGYW